MSQLVLVEGAVFAERYKVIRCIAQGGMGAVYEVIHIPTKKHRALKVMHSNLLDADGMLQRFEQEARVTSDVESEYIVEVMDAGFDAQTRTPYLVMELLRGEDLSRKLKRVKRLPVEEVLTLLGQVASALDKTHQAAIVHRDLKPENMFLTTRDDGSPRIKILDFGVAKMLAEGATSAGATQSLGTPLFMAPEQFSNAASSISPATDIYALGLIAYKLLVGANYWQDDLGPGANMWAFAGIAILGARESPVERAKRAGMELPAAFDEWFAKACALNPRERFGRASEAVEALGVVFRQAPARLSVGPSERFQSGDSETPKSMQDGDDEVRTVFYEKGNAQSALEVAAPAERLESGSHGLKSQTAVGMVRTAPLRLGRNGLWKGAVIAVGMTLGALGVWIGNYMLSPGRVAVSAWPSLESAAPMGTVSVAPASTPSSSAGFPNKPLASAGIKGEGTGVKAQPKPNPEKVQQNKTPRGVYDTRE